MIEYKNLKEKNVVKKILKKAESLAAVHTHTLYCHLENKKDFNLKFKKMNNKNKDRTILKLDRNSIGLSFCALCKEFSHKCQRAGPRL